MSSRAFPFDATLEPPAPIVPLWIRPPLGDGGVALRALIDTGADCTLVPEHVAKALGLPLVDRIRVTGVTGSEQSAPVYAARVEVSGFDETVKVTGLGNEALIGRDLLNRWFMTLDGPAGRVAIGKGRKRKSR